MIRVLCSLLFVALATGLCQAQNCDQPATLQESAECAQLRLRAAEREMLEQMRLLEALEDDGLKKAVAAAQDAWLKWRDAEGDVALAATGDLVLARIARDAVKAQLTEDRVRDLRSYTGQ